MSPDARKYSKEHEWIKMEDATQALAGITVYAQDQLGDIVYVDLPKLGATIKFMEKMGEVESVKAVSDLYSPITGEITEVNDRLLEHPELVNEDPLGEGWMVRRSGICFWSCACSLLCSWPKSCACSCACGCG